MSGGILFVSIRYSTEVNGKTVFENRLYTQGNAGGDELACDHGGPCTIGLDPIRIIRNAHWPAFSEANGTIAVAACFGGCGIWRTGQDGCDNSGRGCVRLTQGGSDTAPAWSPDGSKLAFRSHEDGTYEIYTVGLNGGPRNRLTHGGGNNVAPTWSPDGQWIAYLSDRTGQWAVWAIKPDGSTDTKMFDLGAPVFDGPSRRISWAP